MARDAILDVMRQAVREGMSAKQTVRIYSDNVVTPRYISVEHKTRRIQTVEMVNGRRIHVKGFDQNYERGLSVCALVGDNERGRFGSARVSKTDSVPGGAKGLVKPLDRLVDEAFQASNEVFLEHATASSNSAEDETWRFTHLSEEPATRYIQTRPRRKKIPADTLCELRKWTHKIQKLKYVDEATATVNFTDGSRRFVDSESRRIKDYSFEGIFRICVTLKHRDNSKMAYTAFTPFTQNSSKTYHLVMEMLENATEFIPEMRTSLKVRSGQYPILLSHAGTGDLSHEGGAGHTMSGEAIQGRISTAYEGKIGSRIMPEFMTLIEDPTREGFGHYVVDAEGVRSKKQVLVKNGFLVGYLHSRSSAAFFGETHSTGHARLSWPDDSEGNTITAEPRASNLDIYSSNTLPDSELVPYLAQMCREKGYEFGLYVDTGDCEVDMETGMFSLDPMRAWKIFPDGKMRAARDFKLVGLPDDLFSRIVVTGDTRKTTYGYCESTSGDDVPIESCAPMTILSYAQVTSEYAESDTTVKISKNRTHRD